MKRKVAKDVLFRVAREDFQTNGFALIPGLHIQNNKDLVKAVKSIIPFFTIGKYDGGLTSRDELEDGVLTVNLEQDKTKIIIPLHVAAKIYVIGTEPVTFDHIP
mgnify:CR=1 FL=1